MLDSAAVASQLAFHTDVALPPRGRGEHVRHSSVRLSEEGIRCDDALLSAWSLLIHAPRLQRYGWNGRSTSHET